MRLHFILTDENLVTELRCLLRVKHTASLKNTTKNKVSY